MSVRGFTIDSPSKEKCFDFPFGWRAPFVFLISLLLNLMSDYGLGVRCCWRMLTCLPRSLDSHIGFAIPSSIVTRTLLDNDNPLLLSIFIKWKEGQIIIRDSTYGYFAGMKWVSYDPNFFAAFLSSFDAFPYYLRAVLGFVMGAAGRDYRIICGYNQITLFFSLANFSKVRSGTGL